MLLKHLDHLHFLQKLNYLGLTSSAPLPRTRQSLADDLRAIKKDSLVSQLQHGKTNPGIGNNPLGFGGIRMKLLVLRSIYGE